MERNLTDQLRGFDLLSQPAQQRLRARVADAGGDIKMVADEIQAELDALDSEIVGRPEAVQSQYLADRAFFVGQLSFLELLARAEAQSDQPQRGGLLARLRAAFGRAPAVE